MSNDQITRKLLFRASHRGIREMDIVLGRFCSAKIEAMDARQFLVLSAVLHINDQPMYQALCEDEADEALCELVVDAPEEFQAEMLTMLQDIYGWMRTNPYRGDE